MGIDKKAGGKIQWGRMLGKLSPYTVQKGLRYLKHYGPKEFWVRLHERFEPEEIPYGHAPDKVKNEEQAHLRGSLGLSDIWRLVISEDSNAYAVKSNGRCESELAG